MHMLVSMPIYKYIQFKRTVNVENLAMNMAQAKKCLFIWIFCFFCSFKLHFCCVSRWPICCPELSWQCLTCRCHGEIYNILFSFKKCDSGFVQCCPTSIKITSLIKVTKNNWKLSTIRTDWNNFKWIKRLVSKFWYFEPSQVQEKLVYSFGFMLRHDTKWVWPHSVCACIHWCGTLRGLTRTCTTLGRWKAGHKSN